MFRCLTKFACSEPQGYGMEGPSQMRPWKGVVRFGKRGKLNPRYVGPFKVLEKVGEVAYKVELPEELSRVHNTFHFVEEPIKIMDREVKWLRKSCVPIAKVRWNSKRGPEFTWEREDQFKKKYPHLFTKTASSSSAASEQVGLPGDLRSTNDVLIPLKMDNPDITMEKYIQLEAEKPRRRGHEINWETATYGKVRYFEDMEYFKYFKNEFPAIVYNDALTLELEISSEPTISAHHVKK
ncbi:hypothetical protein Tco_0240963, partial [Tanacetum coccineum]